MNENPNEQKQENEEDHGDDLQEYVKDMNLLETDFSDLDDLDLEELKDMQDAITKVKEQEELISKDPSLSPKNIEEISLLEEESENVVEEEYLEQKEALISDFSDLDAIDFNELKEMKEAIETVKHDEQIEESGKDAEVKTIQEIPTELEDRIKEELLKKKEKEEKEIITPEKFLEYIKEKREKIWYHALYYLVFQVEDHTASKGLLYDVLKETTSKSPIDPIPEHQFYFGLGYLLRLTLNDKKIIQYMRGGKFKININVDILKELLEINGEPISNRPVIEEKEKKKMFKDFLEDDFLDI
jgi:hypothetical protein